MAGEHSRPLGGSSATRSDFVSNDKIGKYWTSARTRRNQTSLVGGKAAQSFHTSTDWCAANAFQDFTLAFTNSLKGKSQRPTFYQSCVCRQRAR